MTLSKRGPAGELLYWEIWQDKKTLTVHYGEVGDTGWAEEYELENKKDGPEAIAELTEAQLAQGYAELDPDSMYLLEVKYRIEGCGSEEDMEKYDQVTDLMDNCLNWTGNGYSNESDIGGDSMNIGCYVIDPEKALATILQELEENDLLEGVTIAVLEKTAGEASEEADLDFRILHPPGGEYYV